MHYLKERILVFLTKNLNYSSVCQSYEIANRFNFEILKLECEVMLQLDILSALSSTNIKRINQKTLEIILKADLINCREYELFCVVMNGWATQKCLEANILATGPNLREQLGKAFNLIQFHSMKSDEFINCLKPYNEMLDPIEAMEILMFINNGTKIVGKFEKKNRTKTEILLLNEKLKLCKRFIKTSEMEEAETSNEKRTNEDKVKVKEPLKRFDLIVTKVKLNFKVSENIFLSGVGLMKRNSFVTFKFETKDFLTLTVTNVENQKILSTEIISKSYIKEFQDEHFCVHSFLLEKPIAIEKDVDYCIELNVTFLQYYLKMLCKNEVDVENVKFTFNSETNHIAHLLFKGAID